MSCRRRTRPMATSVGERQVRLEIELANAIKGYGELLVEEARDGGRQSIFPIRAPHRAISSSSMTMRRTAICCHAGWCAKDIG
jgi:hypothetical protein